MSGAGDPGAVVAAAAAMGIELRPADAERLLAFLQAMLEWNRAINLTAVRDFEQAVVLHLLDSLAVGLAGFRPSHCLDLGSGNGFPGVAAAVLFPGASVVLMDRTRKKVRALDACLLTAGLARVETLWLDAGQAPARRPDLRRAFDLVTARAVGPPARVAPLAAPLLRPGGRLVLWLDEETELPRLADFDRGRTVPYELPDPSPRRRRLGIWRRQ